MHFWQKRYFQNKINLLKSRIKIRIRIYIFKELNEDDFLSDVYSMADVLQLKNCAEIIKFRRQVTKLSSIWIFENSVFPVFLFYTFGFYEIITFMLFKEIYFKHQQFIIFNLSKIKRWGKGCPFLPSQRGED